MQTFKTNNQKGFASIVIVGIVAVAILLGVVGYFVFVKKSEPITQTPAQTDETANWKTYQNQIHNYSFKYPQLDYKITDGDPSGEGDVPPGKFGNFLWKTIGFNNESTFAVGVISTPEWSSIPNGYGDLDALEKGFKSGGIREVAKLSREVNLDRQENFPNKQVSDIKEFHFYNGIGYGFTVTGVFTFGFNTARKGGFGGEVIQGKRVVVYVANGKDVYSIEFPDGSLENQIFSTFKFTEQTTKTDTSNKTFSYGKISFQYPSEWKAEVIEYGGDVTTKGDWGFVVYKKINTLGNSLDEIKSDFEFVSNCNPYSGLELQNYITRCVNLDNGSGSTYPLFTKSKDTATLAVFDQIVLTVKIIK